MKRKGIRLLLLSLCFTLLLGLSACGEQITVTIQDGDTPTELTVSAGKKVSKILKEAEITLGDQDTISVDLDTKLKEDTTIVIGRWADVTVTCDGESYPVGLAGGTVADAIAAAGITMTEKEYLDPELELDSLLTNGEIINVAHYFEVNLVQGGEASTVYTKAETVQALLDELGIVTSDSLQVTPDPATAITDGMTVTAADCVSITVNIDGGTQELWTAGTTVGEALGLAGLGVDDDDRISPEKDTSITEGLEITVQRVEVKEETVTEDIPYDKVTQNDSSMDKGDSYVSQKGKKGSKQVTYSVTYVDGVEESREVITETVISEPVDQITVVGTKKGKTEIRREYYDDCDGSGHGFYRVWYDDGTTEDFYY